MHEQIIALRAVETTDFMTAGGSHCSGLRSSLIRMADWFPFDGKFLKRVSSRIVNEVEGVCRVVYDGEYSVAYVFVPFC